mgnify:CR=1 FL=1|jgi:hypothetical protein|tara:strand:- start:199 stop:399 length:201 start_codon:yes stop_codon:yes gene_type:complete
MGYGDSYKETPQQKQMFKLMAALQQIDNITNLLYDNEYKDYIYNHLVSIKCELDRQMSHIVKENNQ